MNTGSIILPESEAGIQEALKAANGDLPTTALAHLFTNFQEVSWHAMQAEMELERLYIPKRLRAGASRVITSSWAKLEFGRVGGEGPGHGHQATRITIVRTAGGWRLASAEKVMAAAGSKPKASMCSEPIQLTRAQAAESIDRYRATFAVAQPVDEAVGEKSQGKRLASA